jgi:tRNA(Leu) C34 or U34 (ribose-2'-O)-methylase TrmL
MRAAHAFGVQLILLQGCRFRRTITDTPHAWKSIPVVHTDDVHASIPYDCVPIAVERTDNAVSLVDFVHPARALYIFGPEDGTMGRQVFDWCKHVVKIPSGSLNLAMCANVVLYDRMAKAVMRQKRDQFFGKVTPQINLSYFDDIKEFTKEQYDYLLARGKDRRMT